MNALEAEERILQVEEENEKLNKKLDTMNIQLTKNTSLLEENKETMQEMIKVFKAATGAMKVIQFIGGFGLKLAAISTLVWHLIISIKERFF